MSAIPQSWSTTLQARPDLTVVASVLVRFRCGRELQSGTFQIRRLPPHCELARLVVAGTLERRVSSPLDVMINIVLALMVLPRWIHELLLAQYYTNGPRIPLSSLSMQRHRMVALDVPFTRLQPPNEDSNPKHS
ncbi:hypothetical protein KC337_g21 [Hortaea werneckii]|nr:hypothetical protein KC337_g21 [Hortaea werneckii]